MADTDFNAVAAAKALNEQLRRQMAQSQQTLKGWVQKKQEHVSDSLHQHQQNMVHLSAEAEQQQVVLSNLIIEKRRVAVEKEKENLEGDNLQKDVNNINAQKAELAKEVQNIQQLQQQQASILEQKQSEIARVTQNNMGIVAELKKSLSFYQKLGLNFEQLENRNLKLTFTLIDPRDHARPFSFLLLINSHDQYEVQACNPHIPALPLLLSTLNSTNDFSGFIIAMRQQFKATVM